MKLEYYKKALALMVIPFFIASCELLGLDYQDSYDYCYSAGMPSNKIDMSAFEFTNPVQIYFLCWKRLFCMQELKMSLNKVE